MPDPHKVMTDNYWGTHRHDLIQLTAHGFLRLTVPFDDGPIIEPCEGCTKIMGDGAIVYHVCAEREKRGNPDMLELMAIDLLSVALQ